MFILFRKRGLHILYIILAIAGLILGGISHVRAEEPSREEREQMVTPPPPQREAGLGAGGMGEVAQNRFINLVRNTFNRMDGALLRFEDISERLLTRANKLETQGFVVTDARTTLYDARAKIASARTALANAKTSAENGILSDTPRERFKVARAEFAQVRTSILEIHALLRASLVTLRSAVRTETTQEAIRPPAEADPLPESESRTLEVQ